MSNLKQKTVNGLFWSSFDSIINQGGSFIILILLARILTPVEFGLVGLTIIFITIAQVIAEGGLSYALIRRQDCTKKDFSTVFYFNITLSILLYVLIYTFSPFIATFFNQPILSQIIKLLAISIVIGSITSVQQTILTKKINFKVQAIISLIAVLLSGTISIYLAIKGYGVWSLVWRTLINQGVRSILLIFHNRWVPLFCIDSSSLKAMLHFGYKFMIINLLNVISKNIYNAIIGKSYSPTTLGYYTTADNCVSMASNTTSLIINKVAYPVLSKVNDNVAQLKQTARNFLSLSMLFSFALMIYLAVAAKPIIMLLLGEKWVASAPFLQLLCFAYIIFPAQQINQSIILSRGRSGLLLVVEVFKYLFIIPVIILGVLYGIYILLIGFIIHYWLGYIILAYATKITVGYTLSEQLHDSWKSGVAALFAGSITFFISLIVSTSAIGDIIISFSIFVVFFVISCELTSHTAYKQLKQVILNHTSRFFNNVKRL